MNQCRSWLGCVAALTLLLACGDLACGAEPSPQLAPRLTPAERAWLAEHDEVRLAYDAHFPPYSFRGEGGAIEGFVVDVFQRLSERTGLRFVVHGETTWDALYAAARARRVDVVATMVDRPERREWFGFTAPYVNKALVVMARDDDERIRQRQNLANKRVALVRGYQYSSRVLEEFPSVEPVYFETMVDALNAVSTHRADAAITFLAGGHYLRAKHMMSNLRFAAVYDAEASVERIAVRSDWPALRGILDKALETISDAERLELEKRWLPPALPKPTQLELTEAEQAWVDAHPVIRLGVDPEFHPFEFIDAEGRHRGIAADYVALLNERTGLNLELVSGLTWSEVMERARRQEIDALAAVGITDERRTFLTYSPSYVQFHRVIVARSEVPFIASLADLKPLRVAVQANSSHAGFLADHTDLEPLAYPSLQEAIMAVADGRADALVGNLASTTYWIRELNVANLKVAGAASPEPLGLYFATRKDWPILAGIVQKGLASITERERAEIAQRWVVLDYTPQLDYGPLARVTLGAVLLLLAALGWILHARSQRLQLERARRQSEEANATLQRMHGRLEELVEERTAELRRSEALFRQAQKMEAMGTLVSGVVHDFNNLLTGLLGAIGLARAEADDPEALAEHLDLSHEIATRGAELLQQLLSFARQEELDLTHVSIDELLERAQRLFESAISSHVGLQVGAQTPGLWVRGSAALLEQALFNLVLNACDAGQGGEGVRVEVSAHACAASEAAFASRYPDAEVGGLVELRVSDDGRGIPPDQQARLFDPYYTTKPAEKGTGLGLAMVYGAVRDHGGVITVESEPGEGTTFRILLPAVAPPAEAT